MRIVKPCEDKVQRYITKYLEVPVGDGLRRHELNKLALRLTHHLQRHELEATLYQVVGNEPKMVKRVPAIVEDVYRHIEAA
jgi:hypothetical protein